MASAHGRAARQSRSPGKPRPSGLMWDPFRGSLRLYVAHGCHELRLRYELAAYARLGRELEHPAHDVELYRLQDELIAGKHRPLEARIVYAGEEKKRFGVVAFTARHVGKDRRHLRHRLDDEHARHHRVAGKVALEKRLVHRHVLDRLDALPHFALEYAVD